MSLADADSFLNTRFLFEGNKQQTKVTCNDSNKQFHQHEKWYYNFVLTDETKPKDAIQYSNNTTYRGLG